MNYFTLNVKIYQIKKRLQRHQFEIKYSLMVVCTQFLCADKSCLHQPGMLKVYCLGATVLLLLVEFDMETL